MNRVPDSELDEEGPNGLCYHDDAPFIGISFSLYPTGELEYEEEHRAGVLWGAHRRYRKDGRLLEEGNRVAGHIRMWRTWHPNGQLAIEAFYHFDCEMARVKWDPEGRLIEDFVLAETAPQFLQLLKYREIFGRNNEPIPIAPKLPTGEGPAQPAPGEPI